MPTRCCLSAIQDAVSGPRETLLAHIRYGIRLWSSVLDCKRPFFSESLNQMDRQQLQKFAQYLISQHYNDVLPTAQRLADEVLRIDSEINAIHGKLLRGFPYLRVLGRLFFAGAPDPTAGPPDDDLDDHCWFLDDNRMRAFVRCYLSHMNSSTDQFRQLFSKVTSRKISSSLFSN